MKTLKIKLKAWLMLAIVAVGAVLATLPVSAAKNYSYSVSPMKQSIVLNPGDTYYGSFKVVSPNDNEYDIEYEIEQRSFYVDDQYSTVYDENNSAIVDWTTITSGQTGSIKPNDNRTVMFTINVPENATAGGQYEAFRVKTKAVEAEGEGNLVIQEQLIITYLLYAEIAGDTVRQGEIMDISVPGFLFTDNISGSAAIKNTGNIHEEAKYTLQVFPLFSGEEVYTNEENPETAIILPDRVRMHDTVWNETPSIGIFNVVYTAEFAGVTAQVKKMVIVCPVWLLFVIIFAVFLIIGWIVVKVRGRKKSYKRIG